MSARRISLAFYLIQRCMLLVSRSASDGCGCQGGENGYTGLHSEEIATMRWPVAAFIPTLLACSLTAQTPLPELGDVPPYLYNTLTSLRQLSDCLGRVNGKLPARVAGLSDLDRLSKGLLTGWSRNAPAAPGWSQNGPAAPGTGPPILLSRLR